ncbi:hypothetical protein KY330_00930 [Candidatus Woesearchaeota archaeon]|nr:hypothetical protein [Candidatus Woesearchaeota archaeon]
MKKIILFLVLIVLVSGIVISAEETKTEAQLKQMNDADIQTYFAARFSGATINPTGEELKFLFPRLWIAKPYLDKIFNSDPLIAVDPDAQELSKEYFEGSSATSNMGKSWEAARQYFAHTSTSAQGKDKNAVASFLQLLSVNGDSSKVGNAPTIELTDNSKLNIIGSTLRVGDTGVTLNLANFGKNDKITIEKDNIKVDVAGMGPVLFAQNFPRGSTLKFDGQALDLDGMKFNFKKGLGQGTVSYDGNKLSLGSIQDYEFTLKDGRKFKVNKGVSNFEFGNGKLTKAEIANSWTFADATYTGVSSTLNFDKNGKLVEIDYTKGGKVSLFNGASLITSKENTASIMLVSDFSSAGSPYANGALLMKDDGSEWKAKGQVDVNAQGKYKYSGRAGTTAGLNFANNKYNLALDTSDYTEGSAGTFELEGAPKLSFNKDKNGDLIAKNSRDTVSEGASNLDVTHSDSKVKNLIVTMLDNEGLKIRNYDSEAFRTAAGQRLAASQAVLNNELGNIEKLLNAKNWDEMEKKSLELYKSYQFMSVEQKAKFYELLYNTESQVHMQRKDWYNVYVVARDDTKAYRDARDTSEDTWYRLESTAKQAQQNAQLLKQQGDKQALENYMAWLAEQENPDMQKLLFDLQQQREVKPVVPAKPPAEAKPAARDPQGVAQAKANSVPDYTPALNQLKSFVNNPANKGQWSKEVGTTDNTGKKVTKYVDAQGSEFASVTYQDGNVKSVSYYKEKIPAGQREIPAPVPEPDPAVPARDAVKQAAEQNAYKFDLSHAQKVMDTINAYDLGETAQERSRAFSELQRFAYEVMSRKIDRNYPSIVHQGLNFDSYLLDLRNLARTSDDGFVDANRRLDLLENQYSPNPEKLQQIQETRNFIRALNR